MNVNFKQKRIVELTVNGGNAGKAIDILAREAGLSKRVLKDCMLKGAVWLQRPRGKRKRLRRATTVLQPGDLIALYYDEQLLLREPPPARRLWSCNEYSVWYKPAGLLAQGNQYGDHASLLRQAELAHPLRKPVYLVHRLDREAEGLMLIAHTQTAARRLSQMFQRQQIRKQYVIGIAGRLEHQQGEITQPLDGKPACTEYQVMAYDVVSNTSQLLVEIKTGRTHQIRRHFELIDHPVMGDPRYGRYNKNQQGLQLRATRLSFVCPFSSQQREFDLAKLLKEPSV